eukprot:540900_1
MGRADQKRKMKIRITHKAFHTQQQQQRHKAILFQLEPTKRIVQHKEIPNGADMDEIEYYIEKLDVRQFAGLNLYGHVKHVHPYRRLNSLVKCFQTKEELVKYLKTLSSNELRDLKSAISETPTSQYSKHRLIRAIGKKVKKIQRRERKKKKEQKERKESKRKKDKNEEKKQERKERGKIKKEKKEERKQELYTNALNLNFNNNNNYTHEDTSHHDVFIAPEPNGCVVCGANFTHMDILRCSRCKIVQYCSEYCQHQHWEVHKLVCEPPIRQEEDESPIQQEISPVQQERSPILPTSHILQSPIQQEISPVQQERSPILPTSHILQSPIQQEISTDIERGFAHQMTIFNLGGDTTMLDLIMIIFQHTQNVYVSPIVYLPDGKSYANVNYSCLNDRKRDI